MGASTYNQINHLVEIVIVTVLKVAVEESLVAVDHLNFVEVAVDLPTVVAVVAPSSEIVVVVPAKNSAAKDYFADRYLNSVESKLYFVVVAVYSDC